MGLSASLYGRALAVTYKVDTDGRYVGLSVGVVGESQEKTRLSDTRVADEEELEEVLESAGWFSFVRPVSHFFTSGRAV